MVLTFGQLVRDKTGHEKLGHLSESLFEGIGGEPLAKTMLAYYGVVVIGTSCMMIAVVRIGESAVMRKVLQYSMVGFAGNIILALTRQPKFSGEQIAYAHAVLQLCNIAVAIYGCYGIPKMGKAAKRGDGPLLWYTRYLYISLFGLGLLCFFPATVGHSEPLKPLDEHITLWLGAALFHASLVLMAVAQCGDTACRKVTQYGMVTWFLAIGFTVTNFNDLPKEAAYAVISKSVLSTLFAIGILFFVTDMMAGSN